MAYTVLARRYRSATFDEVIGQDHIARTLKRAIETGRIAHAYLFCGTRGVGKTSMARILAKALNCQSANGPTPEPCLKCASCTAIARGEDMDVVEIDAASNTQVDKTREVILENAQYRPAHSRFKVYIIDEVHMLSKASFNALLKTLEEPPGHVKFILATTEPEKVLPTILSRCQRYDFRNIPAKEIVEHLREICRQEKIQADDEALMVVARAGAGSMRDALSLLDRLLSVGEKKLTAEMVEQLVGLPRTQLVFELVQSMGEGDVKAVLSQADAIIQSGLSVDSLLAALSDHLRNLLIVRTCGPDSELVEAPALLLDDLAKQAKQFDPLVLTQDITILEELRRQVRQSQAGRALLDATLVRLALAEQFTSVAELLDRVDGQAPAAAVGQKKKPEIIADRRSEIEDWVHSRENPDLRSPSSDLRTSDLPEIWAALIKRLSAQGPALPSLLVHGQLVAMEENQAVIRYASSHATLPRMLERNGKVDQLRRALSELLQKDVGLRFEIAPDEPSTEQTPQQVPTRPAASETPAVAAPPAGVRLTGELQEQLRQDPLIRRILEEFGGTIVKVE